MRAGRNRTLTIDEEEMHCLEEKLLSTDDLKNGAGFTDTTINADLLDVLPLLPSAFADLIIVDPPYNLRKDFHGKVFKQQSEESYKDYLNSWFPGVVDKLKQDGTLYICGDWRCTAAIKQVLEEQRLHILNRITWQREKGRGANRNWKNAMEDIWFAVKDPKNYCFNIEAVKVRRRVIAPYKSNGEPKDWEETANGKYRDTCPSNFWDDITVPFWSMPENTDHPTQKPEKLIAKLILASSSKGDMVFDPFMGSGTTSVVAKKLGRHYCGVEINTSYCCWAEKRLEAADNKKQIQGYEDGVFWERNTIKHTTK